MREFKIGDKVVLRPETKPYTFRSDNDDEIKIEELDYYVYQEFTYIVKEVLDDGDILISHDGYNQGYIAPWHLKHAKEDTAFEDFHENLYQIYSDLFNDLESDLKAELEKIKDIDVVELRLAIFNGNTSRTLEEMKEIESWLLGDK